MNYRASDVYVRDDDGLGCAAALQERERLSRELDDEIGQALSYLSVQLGAVEALLARGQAAAALNNLRQAAQVAHEAQMQLLGHILGLRTMSLGQGSLYEVLHDYLRQFTEACGIGGVLNAPHDAPESVFTPVVAEQVFRIIQEALSNVRKHSAAQEVEILFAFTPSEVQILIDDDGIGFNPDCLQGGNAAGRGGGLAFMRERAEQIGGRLEVRSSPGRGVQVLLYIPIPASYTALPGAGDHPPLQNTRVLLVDGQQLFLESMRTLLRARGITVVGAAANGVEARTLARSLQPDVVVMDAGTPEHSGLDAALRIKTELPNTKIIVLTASESEEDLSAALRNGASGYLLKCSDANQFCRHLAAVVRGEMVLPPALAARGLGARMHRMPAQSCHTASPLTLQQQTILKLVAEGKLYKEIALELNLTERTIKYHMGQILESLHVSTREQAIAYACQSGSLRAR